MTVRSLPRPPALLIFDLDGTLIDSQAAIERSFNAARVAAGAAPVTPETVNTIIGLPLSEMFTQCLPEAMSAAVPTCVQQYRTHHDELEIPHLQPFPGVRETLVACRNSGLVLSLATTKSQAMAQRVLETTALRPLFTLVLGGDSVPHHKPHPALVLRTLGELGYDASEAMVIGDSSYDIGMATGAGVVACGVTYGAQSAEALRRAGAGYLIDSLTELPALIGLHT